MAIEFIPFAQMTTAEKREHLVKAHGFTEGDVRWAERETSLAAEHRADHRSWDGTSNIPVPHQHTKVSRRTKR